MNRPTPRNTDFHPLTTPNSTLDEQSSLPTDRRLVPAPLPLYRTHSVQTGRDMRSSLSLVYATPKRRSRYSPTERTAADRLLSVHTGDSMPRVVENNPFRRLIGWPLCQRLACGPAAWPLWPRTQVCAATPTVYWSIFRLSGGRSCSQIARQRYLTPDFGWCQGISSSVIQVSGAAVLKFADSGRALPYLMYRITRG